MATSSFTSNVHMDRAEDIARLADALEQAEAQANSDSPCFRNPAVELREARQIERFVESYFAGKAVQAQ